MAMCGHDAGLPCREAGLPIHGDIDIGAPRAGLPRGSGIEAARARQSAPIKHSSWRCAT